MQKAVAFRVDALAGRIADFGKLEKRNNRLGDSLNALMRYRGGDCLLEVREPHESGLS
jgi:hypothetical protein